MHHKDLDTHIPELIARYLSRNASDADTLELENWVLEHPDNKQLFIAFKKAWMLAGAKSEHAQIDVDALWDATKKQTLGADKIVQPEPKKTRRLWLRIAAAIALLVVASFFVFQNVFSNQPLVATTTNTSKSLNLKDGSQVTLNQDSKLTFALSDQKRKVTLNGDAFFDVARDEQQPFIIKASDLEIEVLGTSFYVDARSQNAEIQVIVESGSVAVRSGGQEQILTANEKAVFKKSNKHLAKTDNDDPNYLALKSNILTFNNTKLPDVVFALNRQFNVNITLENEILNDCTYSTTFTNKSIDAILKIMESTLGIQYDQNGKDIVLKGICNN